jgi:hypothetical protein
VAVNYAAATKWFEKAAEQGDPEAQYNLGVALADGKGTSQNYELAAAWQGLTHVPISAQP